MCVRGTFDVCNNPFPFDIYGSKKKLLKSLDYQMFILGALKFSRQNLWRKLCLKRIKRVYASQFLIFQALCRKKF